MSAALSLDYVTLEQYIRAEESSQARHEFVAGQIRLMAGASPAHTDIVDNLAAACYRALKDFGCRGASSDQRVQVEETGDTFYPDYLIKCPPHRFSEKDKLALLNPRVIFEVLSKSTADYDQVVKFDLYSLIPECTDYVLIAQNRVRVVHYQRMPGGPWVVHRHILRSDELIIEELGLKVRISEIYDRVDVPEGIRLVEPDESSTEA